MSDHQSSSTPSSPPHYHFGTQDTPAMSGRSLVALALLIGAIAFLFYHVPSLYPKISHAGGALTTAALLLINTSAVILAVISAALFLVGSLRWAFADQWLPIIQHLQHASERNEQTLKLIADRVLVSEATKRITYREKDRLALKESIQEDIQRKDFEAALALVNEMANTFGYKTEAEEYRAQIENLRNATINARIKDAMRVYEKHLELFEWEKATTEAAKIQRLFPNVPQVRDLAKRVKDEWQNRKHDLERRLKQSASRDDVEGSMELLRELDHYLTPEEAAPFVELARGVFDKKRQNLGVQFKLAIQDKEWVQAVSVGDQIIREFPNSKMADEVRATIEILRERAAGQRDAESATETNSASPQNG